jgi:exopolysaccharide production protein ExoY
MSRREAPNPVLALEGKRFAKGQTGEGYRPPGRWNDKRRREASTGEMRTNGAKLINDGFGSALHCGIEGRDCDEHVGDGVQTAKLASAHFGADFGSSPVGPQGKARHRTPGLSLTRIADLVLAGGLILFVAPLLVIIALAIWAHDGGPAIFAQTRIGRDGRRFKCLKFRTMVVGAEARLQALLARDPVARQEWEADQKLRHDPRITALGRFLRKSSLDELPQLFNVLRGEMSLVGPRPIVESEIAKYGRWYRHYCGAVPGITGLWQVSGRNKTTYERRVQLDALYVDTRTPLLDLWIAVRTVRVLLTREGAM